MDLILALINNEIRVFRGMSDDILSNGFQIEEQLYRVASGDAKGMIYFHYDGIVDQSNKLVGFEITNGVLGSSSVVETLQLDLTGRWFNNPSVEQRIPDRWSVYVNAQIHRERTTITCMQNFAYLLVCGNACAILLDAMDSDIFADDHLNFLISCLHDFEKK